MAQEISYGSNAAFEVASAVQAVRNCMVLLLSSHKKLHFRLYLYRNGCKITYKSSS